MFHLVVLKQIDCVFIKSSLVYTICHVFRRTRISFKLINKNNSEVLKSNLTIALSKSLFKMQLVLNVIYGSWCMSTYPRLLIYCWYHTKFKHQIYKNLDIFVCFKIESKIFCKKKTFVNYSTI